MSSTLDTAGSYLCAGLNVIPLRVDGTKAPAIKWTQYQTTAVTDAELEQWFTVKHKALGVVCGATSGNLLVIDFDNIEAWYSFCSILGQHQEIEAILNACPTVATPRPGRHVYIRCSDPVGGSEKLAIDEAGHTDIETRGQGGYVVAVGGSVDVHTTKRPYELASGSFENIPVVTPSVLASILDLCRSLSKAPLQADTGTQKPTEGTTAPAGTITHPATKQPAGGLTPVDDYNETGDVLALLERNGWTVTERQANGDVLLKRPGKQDQGHSATYHAEGTRKLSIWSSNASPFEAGKHYSPFDVYSTLEHGRNYDTAVYQLAQAGFGDEQPVKHLKLEKANTKVSASDDPVDECIRLMKLLQHPEGLPRASYTKLFALAYEALDEVEQLVFRDQLAKMKVSRDLLDKLLVLANPRPEPQAWTMEQLRRMERETVTELPIIGMYGHNAFIQGRTHCLTAKPNMGKTELLAQSACFWDMPVVAITEDSLDVWQTRARAYASAGLPENPRLTILPALAEGHAFVTRILRQAEPGSVVIVDTLRAFAGVEDEASGSQWTAAVDPWCKISKDRGLTLICSHHNRKGGESDDPSESASGSNALMSRFEQRLSMKASNGAKVVSGQAKNWPITPSQWRWQGARLVPVGSEEREQQADTLEQMLLEELSPYSPLTVKAIMEALSAKGYEPDAATVRAILSKLKRTGKVINTSTTGVGKWIINAGKNDK